MTSSILTSYKVCDSVDQHAMPKVAIKYEVRDGSREEQRGRAKRERRNLHELQI